MKSVAQALIDGAKAHGVTFPRDGVVRFGKPPPPEPPPAPSAPAEKAPS